MQVGVIASVNEARADRFTHRTAIVIDVLRATSTMVAALEAGVTGIVPAETVMEARALVRPGDLLGGERFCRKIAGFDLSNSPSEYRKDTVGGKRIVLTTTNGTRAILKALRAENILTGALVNATACARTALELRRDVVLLCAGSHEEFALEDGLCAGMLLDRMESLCTQSVETDDFGSAMLALYRNRAHSLAETISNSATGRRLTKMGLARDIEYCAGTDVSDVVPRLSGDSLTRA
ncbi:2-phosphosulfolactate phosphatase [Paenibacillus curdlanolyticus YK9]|uniref:Probable 2-phosphosulfolactate phosphatase n=1 Tax=Paenibacillus curdlanolyticus YK9 TaxID=717606 RepID=E0ICK2_9BACL|nr:2-phosphosulfolactate phosphatase [Paenibacillus curdlanolyticus]EFM09888.1 2-phosphosulfolactate phosphatase [Paenibacillus curdlanolyticus YK9]